MKTNTLFIAVIICLGFPCLLWSSTAEPMVLGSVDPEAELEAIRSMKVLDDDQRIVVITWFPNEIFKSSLSILKDGTTHYSYSNPFLKGPPRSLPHAAPSSIPEPGFNLAKTILLELPSSSEPDNTGNLLIVSVRTEDQWLHHIYDRILPPEEIKKLCVALGIGEIVRMNPESGDTADPPKLKAIGIILGAVKPSPDFNAKAQQVVQALASLAVAQGLDPEDFTAFRMQGGFDVFSGGSFARQIKTADSEHLLVVQIVEPMCIPGTSAEQLVLLSPRGRILDRLQCHMNSRYGRIVHEILEQPESDGTQIILRFRGHTYPKGTNWWHNWHTITHQEATKTFRDKEREGRNEWDEKGLVRIAIRDDQFTVLFPKMKKQDQPTKGSTVPK